MNHTTKLDYIIFWSSLLTVLITSHAASGLLTDSNVLHCTQIQCPTKCPEDSYLKSAQKNEEENFEDYQDEFLSHHDPYTEEIGNFENMPPDVQLHDDNLPQHLLKERQRREVFFPAEVERCCDNQKCVCNKCPDVPKCAADHIAVEVHEGHAVPGNCCSLFRCVKKVPCQLGVKQSWWTSKCRKCSCFGDSELCVQICPEEETLQSCYSEYWQKPMLIGMFWKEGSCTSCSCEQGERRCFTPVCPKLECQETIKIDDECCAKCLQEVKDDITDMEKDSEEDVSEEYSKEITNVDTHIKAEDKEANTIYNKNDLHKTVVDEIFLHDTQTSAKESKTPAYSSSSENPNILQNIFTTLSPETIENSSHLESSTSASSSSSTLSPTFAIFSSVITSTENSFKAIYSTPAEDAQIVKEQDKDTATTITADNIITNTEIFSIAEIENIKKSSATDPVTVIDGKQDDYSSFSSATATSYSSTIATTASESSTHIINDSSLEVNNSFSTDAPAHTSNSTSAATESTASLEFSTPNMISSSTLTTTNTDFSKNAPLVSTSTTMQSTLSSVEEHTSAASVATSTEGSFLISTTTQQITTTTTSTTSSPFSANIHPTTSPNTEYTSSISSTSAPEPLKPLFQSYGEIASKEGSTNTQNKMRIILDEIDYVIMIGLFIGSLLCISLGLIIRHTKNRKKMYSSVPNSETSLSQNSTNTVLTIPSYRENTYASSN